MFSLQHFGFSILPLLLLVFLCFGIQTSVQGVTTNPLPSSSTEENLDSQFKSSKESNGLKGELVFAHVLFRHGDRTPINPYKNDPWGDLKYWPTGWGQLTNIGKNQHYQLGQWLRSRYDTILNRTYSNNDIYIQSTDVDRTLMSALSDLAGLYPPVDGQIWNRNLQWQPIPVHTVPEKYDIVAAKFSCPSYDYALEKLKNSAEFQKMNAQYKNLYTYLTKYTGDVVNTLEKVQRLNNTFFIEELYNRTLPDWVKSVYPGHDMNFITNFYFSVPTYNRYLARLKFGPLVKEILERFNNKAKGVLKPDRSIWIYSAHDTTVASLLNTFKLFDYHSPPYVACLMLEMRIYENQPLISIFYKNTTAEPTPMYIPDCGVACPLNKFYELYEDILPNDWNTECQLSALMTYDDGNIGTAVGILVSIICIMLFLSYAVILYHRRRNYRDYFSFSQMT